MEGRIDSIDGNLQKVQYGKEKIQKEMVVKRVSARWMMWARSYSYSKKVI